MLSDVSDANGWRGGCFPPLSSESAEHAHKKQLTWSHAIYYQRDSNGVEMSLRKNFLVSELAAEGACGQWPFWTFILII